MSDAITGWIKTRREMLTSPQYGEGDAVLTATTALDALESVLEMIEGTDRDWTPYFDDSSKHAAGYRLAVHQVLDGVAGAIESALSIVAGDDQ